ncbi:hypothetical protein PPERSA_12202 [Pseudocohnilembus persalinus]|uniref:Uncharacterized protein n=1 Tax=Pseudocohnilembus persalinus TaxID=266149 RepID=A0A0V0R8Q0_PSEPJ|nr:hypothetical protein PPERSA_12202 [Pseudocohnilembus persalinus]|eukprot:KRX10851.1 hypothetical protein PPERSA_12202 [Pseudocohnilembus persalinus]
MGNSQISVKLEDILNQTQDNDILQMTNAFVQQDISTDQFFEETLTGENLNRNRKFDENRLTLLQCILALFGATLYRHNHGELFINPFIKYFTSPQNIKLNLVYDSLLATVLQHRENGFLPFSSMTQNKIQRHDLALLSSQLVSIMMYETGNWELANNQLDDSLSIQAIYRNYIGQFQITSGQQQLTVSSVMQGIYSNQVSQILQEDVGGVAINSVQKFVKSILNLLENPVKFSQQLIYGSFGQIGFVEELLAIFYRYATRNQKVYEEILESKKDLVKMFKVIMFCFCSSLEHQSMNNPFFICLAIFIHFSESDNFKQMLKMDLDFSYPSLRYFPVVGGSYGDFLVSCISQNIINGHFNNKNHYAYNQMALMTNISNILQNLSELTSNKLMQLMQVFTDFDFLLQNVYHPLCLIKLMSFIDNVLALQANQNPYLIFELCKSSNIINRAYKINFQENTLRGFLGDPQALEKMQAKIHNRSIRKSSSIQNQPSQQLQQSQQQENRQRQLPFTNKEPKKIILPNEEQMQDDKFFNSFAHKMPKEEQENLIQFWKNFDWQNYRKNMPRNNLEAVLLKVQEYLKQSNKKTLSLEHIYEMCNKKVFKDVVQVSEANYNTESFDLNGEIELILRSYTWSNVFAKSTQRPFFDPEKCVFYQRISQQHYADIFHQNLEDFEGEEGGEEGEQEEFQNNEQDVSLENHPSNDDVNRLNKRKNIGSKENELQIQDKQEVQFQKKKSNEQVQAEKGQKVENYEDEEEEEEESKVSKSGEVKKPPQKKASNNNNLYIISEADSKKEETMMAQVK